MLFVTLTSCSSDAPKSLADEVLIEKKDELFKEFRVGFGGAYAFAFAKNNEIDKEGWIPKINQTYRELMDNKEALKKAGLFGFSVMELFDDPTHDRGGYQFFIDNKYHIGIIATGATALDTLPDGALKPKGDVLDILFP